MEDKNKVFVNEKSFARLVKELGYKPENIVVSNYIPNGEAIVVDVKEMSSRVFGRNRIHF